jgi:DnaJ-class molecular chaperone
MEDYYKLFNANLNTSVQELNEIYNQKIYEFHSLPFLTQHDKILFKKYKKAHFIFNNPKYKKIYDNYIKNKKTNDVTYIGRENNKKDNIPNDYLTNRIFSNFNTRKNNINIDHNEMLRPKNVGLSADIEIEQDTPLEFEKTKEIMPYNFDS